MLGWEARRTAEQHRTTRNQRATATGHWALKARKEAGEGGKTKQACRKRLPRHGSERRPTSRYHRLCQNVVCAATVSKRLGMLVFFCIFIIIEIARYRQHEKQNIPTTDEKKRKETQEKEKKRNLRINRLQY